MSKLLKNVANFGVGTTERFDSEWEELGARVVVYLLTKKRVGFVRGKSGHARAGPRKGSRASRVKGGKKETILGRVHDKVLIKTYQLDRHFLLLY